MTTTTIDRSEWIVSTAGDALGFLIDQGDPVIIWREAERTEPDENGEFVARYEVVSVPNGKVRVTIEAMGVGHIHKTLAKLIEAGLIS